MKTHTNLYLFIMNNKIPVLNIEILLKSNNGTWSNHPESQNTALLMQKTYFQQNNFEQAKPLYMHIGQFYYNFIFFLFFTSCVCLCVFVLITIFDVQHSFIDRSTRYKIQKVQGTINIYNVLTIGLSIGSVIVIINFIISIKCFSLLHNIFHLKHFSR